MAWDRRNFHDLVFCYFYRQAAFGKYFHKPFAEDFCLGGYFTYLSGGFLQRKSLASATDRIILGSFVYQFSAFDSGKKTHEEYFAGFLFIVCGCGTYRGTLRKYPAKILGWLFVVWACGFVLRVCFVHL